MATNSATTGAPADALQTMHEATGAASGVELGRFKEVIDVSIPRPDEPWMLDAVAGTLKLKAGENKSGARIKPPDEPAHSKQRPTEKLAPLIGVTKKGEKRQFALTSTGKYYDIQKKRRVTYAEGPFRGFLATGYETCAALCGLLDLTQGACAQGTIEEDLEIIARAIKALDDTAGICDDGIGSNNQGAASTPAEPPRSSSSRKHSSSSNGEHASGDNGQRRVTQRSKAEERMEALRARIRTRTNLQATDACSSSDCSSCQNQPKVLTHQMGPNAQLQTSITKPILIDVKKDADAAPLQDFDGAALAGSASSAASATTCAVLQTNAPQSNLD